MEPLSLLEGHTLNQTTLQYQGMCISERFVSEIAETYTKHDV